jgi:hypothetical protein
MKLAHFTTQPKDGARDVYFVPTHISRISYGKEDNTVVIQDTIGWVAVQGTMAAAVAEVEAALK